MDFLHTTQKGPMQCGTTNPPLERINYPGAHVNKFYIKKYEIILVISKMQLSIWPQNKKLIMKNQLNRILNFSAQK